MVETRRGAALRPLGLSDDDFRQRRPLRGQITKREVRAVTLYSLGLHPGSVVWDIGAGTGSVAVEAGLIAHLGTVYAIERDESSLPLLQENIERWGCGNVSIFPGEAPGVLAQLPAPDSAFIGGSGGNLDGILDAVGERLAPRGRVVANLAALDRTELVYRKLKDMGFETDVVMVSAARGKDLPDGSLRLESLNPVFVVTGRRPVTEWKVENG